MWILPNCNCVSTTVWLHHMMLTKCLKKSFDGNYTRILCAVLNESRKQHPTKLLLYNHLPPISQTIQEKQAIYAGQCCRNKLISHALDSYTWIHLCWLTSKDLHQLCMDTGYCLEDLPSMMANRDGWWESYDKILCYTQVNTLFLIFIILKYVFLSIFFQDHPVS